ncbi:MAG: ribosome biogenesis GTPase Der [Verrucomicrobiaceae bacterium]|nr:ribosome biogenesis GTPase Der [Verrucomicrobiaceae bacterium]
MQGRYATRTIAIVGRPNVGKSALFNRLAGRRISIVHDQPGVTRDRISADCRLTDNPFTIIDTGGIGSHPDDTFSQEIEQEADIAMEAAKIIIFVVDAQEGLTPVDHHLADYLRKTDRPIYLVANKVDEASHAGLADEFSELGFAPSFAVSAAHNRGILKLAQSISSHLPESAAPAFESHAPIRIALVGRPNVGKSSLVNALLEDDHTIVSDVAGTTRDAVDIPFTHGDINYVLIDTAGLRPRNKQDNTIEIFSAMRAKSSIKRADICALVIDASQGITAQDRKIAGLIADYDQPCLILANKFDLFHPDAPKSERIGAMKDDVNDGLFFIQHAPIIVASAKTGESVTRLFFGVEQIRKSAWEGLNTGLLNRIMQEALIAHPPPSGKNNKRFKLLYATMAQSSNETRSIPTAEFILFCNKRSLLPQSYERYLENSIRKKCAYTGIPIRFTFRERTPRNQGKK